MKDPHRPLAQALRSYERDVARLKRISLDWKPVSFAEYIGNVSHKKHEHKNLPT